MSDQGGLSEEDRKIVTLARGARARVGAGRGVAVRDETGRTYSAAEVNLPGLTVSAVVLAVATAASAGARALEAVAVVGGDGLDEDDRAAVRALGGGAVLLCSDAGEVLGVDSIA